MRFISHVRVSKGLSERSIAEMAGLARETVRTTERDMRHANPRHLELIGEVLDLELLIALVPAEAPASDLSTIAVSLAVIADGFESWKIHFMNLVDEFRRHSDIRLLLLPPSAKLDPRLKALLASIVQSLCEEVGLDAPAWSRSLRFLARPWFVSGIESLKASTLVESPLPFRRNNIFVQDNFLARA